MPRELTRWTPRFTLLEGGSDFEIQVRGTDLRVTLLGTLDRHQLKCLQRRIAPYLVQRGRRIILDGRRLKHVDFRIAEPLREWNRALSIFDHDLMLAGWNPYLRTILTLGDTAATSTPTAIPTPARVTMS
jgi:hypothetical protein